MPRDATANHTARTIVLVGPHFREAVAKFGKRANLTRIDAVLLTHGHADAVMGLDALREVQLCSLPPHVWQVTESVKVFSAKATLDRVATVFPYMSCNAKKQTTLVGQLEMYEVDENVAAPFFIPPTPPSDGVDAECADVSGGGGGGGDDGGGAGMWVTPVPVEHGADYTSLGFGFGVGSADGAFIYISDVSAIYPATMTWLLGIKIAVLVLDGLLWDFARPSHQSVLDALELVKTLGPTRQAYIVGFTCELNVNDAAAHIAAIQDTLPCPVTMAHDGLQFKMNL